MFVCCLGYDIYKQHPPSHNAFLQSSLVAESDRLNQIFKKTNGKELVHSQIRKLHTRISLTGPTPDRSIYVSRGRERAFWRRGIDTRTQSLESSTVFLLNGNEQHSVFQLCVEAPGIHSYRCSVIDRTSTQNPGGSHRWLLPPTME